MTLGEKQELHARLLAMLVLRMIGQGYHVRLGELWRPPEWQAVMIERGLSHLSDPDVGAHVFKLAADVNIRRDGATTLGTAKDHAPFGAWWKKQHPLCRWGGDFKGLVDACHYSIEHQGVK